MIDEVARTPRERRRDGNLKRILDEAMHTIERQGLAGLSMNGLADALDYTPGALYRYFDSKDALLSQLVTRVLGDIRAELDGATRALPARATPLARLLALTGAYQRFARREPRRFGFLTLTLAEPRVVLGRPEDAAPAIEAVRAVLSPVVEVLVAAEEAGQLAPGDAIARALCLFAMVQGVIQMNKLSPRAAGLLDTARLAEEGTESLLRGCGASPRAISSARNGSGDRS
jgi:AcrR family transcriptional regulator